MEGVNAGMGTVIGMAHSGLCLAHWRLYSTTPVRVNIHAWGFSGSLVGSSYLVKLAHRTAWRRALQLLQQVIEELFASWYKVSLSAKLVILTDSVSQIHPLLVMLSSSEAVSYKCFQCLLLALQGRQRPEASNAVQL